MSSINKPSNRPVAPVVAKKLLQTMALFQCLSPSRGRHLVSQVRRPGASWFPFSSHVFFPMKVERIYLNMSTTGSITRFSCHGSPALDDCDLPELQCACHEPAVRQIYYTENYERMCFLKCNVPEGCSLSIREDLLNKYAEQMLNYCTAASNNSLQDALSSSVYLVNEKEQQILQLENKLGSVWSELSDYKKKGVAHDVAHVKRLEDEKYKSTKYSTLFWFMLILYVARIMIPTV